MKSRTSRSLRQTWRDVLAVCCASMLVPGEGVLLAQEPTPAPPAPATAAPDSLAAPTVTKIPPEQLESLVAPIALYPDPLLAQMLVAATYPLEIVQLQQWLAKNPNLKDKELSISTADSASPRSICTKPDEYFALASFGCDLPAASNCLSSASSVNRPDRHNALGATEIERLTALLDEVEQDGVTRALLVTGAGQRTFCSGAALGELQRGAMSGETWSTLTERLASLALPTVCVLNGNVYGGGAEIALACDYRIGVDSLRLLVPAARIGLCYPLAGLQRLRGQARAECRQAHPGGFSRSWTPRRSRSRRTASPSRTAST